MEWSHRKWSHPTGGIRTSTWVCCAASLTWATTASISVTSRLFPDWQHECQYQLFMVRRWSWRSARMPPFLCDVLCRWVQPKVVFLRENSLSINDFCRKLEKWKIFILNQSFIWQSMRSRDVFPLIIIISLITNKSKPSLDSKLVPYIRCEKEIKNLLPKMYSLFLSDEIHFHSFSFSSLFCLMKHKFRFIRPFVSHERQAFLKPVCALKTQPSKYKKCWVSRSLLQMINE